MLICTSCHRHVRESTCPFCGTLSSEPQPLREKTGISGVSRAALLVGALATAATGLQACAPGNPTPDATPDVISAMDAYGAPFDRDAMPQPDAAPQEDAAPQPDVIGLADVYGAPIVDGGSADGN